MMTWVWFKSLPFIRVIGLILLAVAGALLAAKVSRRTSSAARKDAKAVDLMNTSISKDLARSKVLKEAANVDKDAAIEIKAKLDANLERQGKANENMDDVIHRFNSKRLRK